VKLLLDHGANVNSMDGDERTVLIIASIGGYFDIVSLLVEYGVDINQKDLGNWTALHYAIFYGHESIIKYLIFLGTNLSIIDPDTERSLLMDTINTHNEKLIILLLSHGMNVDHCDKKHLTAVDYALKCCPELVPIILNQGNFDDEKKQMYIDLLENDQIANHLAM